MSKLKRKRKKNDGKEEGSSGDDGSNTQQNETGGHQNRIFDRAIASAKKHDIQLKSGRKNAGGGNCSYESVIFNINDRSCFHEKFSMCHEYYRRIWNIDLMNKILDKKIPWNPGMTRQEIIEGFNEIMESGVYERSFFGDMMMVGIACGVRKRILIFNTNEDIITTGHDPVSVVDPRDYGGSVDTDIPVVLSYNLVHFESLEPVNSQDIEKTVKLVNSYSEGRYLQDYGFTRNDMAYLVSSIEPNHERLDMKNITELNQANDNIGQPQQRNEPEVRNLPPTRKKFAKTVESKNSEVEQKTYENETKDGGFKFEHIRFKELEGGAVQCGVCQIKCKDLIVHMNGNDYCTEYFSNMEEFKRNYLMYRYSKFRDKIYGNNKDGNDVTAQPDSSESSKKKEKLDDNNNDFKSGSFCFKNLDNSKVRCGVCQVDCSRLIVHLNKSIQCAKNFNMAEFKVEYSKYRDRIRRRQSDAKNRENNPQRFKENENKRKRESEARQRAVDPKAFQDNVNKWKKKQEEKKKAEDFEGFKKNENKRKRESEARQKAVDPKGFQDNVNKRKKKQEEKKKAEDLEGFKKNENKRKRESEARQKAVDPKGFQDNVNKWKKKQEEKKKAEDFEGFKKNENKRKRESEARQKAVDPKGFQDNVNKWKKKQEEKKKAEDLEGFKKNENKRKRESEARQKAVDPKGFQDNVNKWKKKQEEKKKAEDLEGFKKNENKRKRESEARQKAEDPKGYQYNVNERKKKQEAIKKAVDPLAFKENARQRKNKSRSNVDAGKRLENFQKRVMYGPIFICSSCHQKLFENQVEELTEEVKANIDNIDPGIRAVCIEFEVQVDLGRNAAGREVKSSFLCKPCKGYLLHGKMPKLCTKNGLNVDVIKDEDLKLTELENNLIARNIIFQKIHKLPKSRWSGTHDRLVNVPVGADDVLNTIESLPRTPAEAGIIPIVPVNLKRKLEYKGTHLTQLIDTNKIFKYLNYLRDMGHPSYKFYDDRNTYEKRCYSEDPTGAKLIFPEAEAEIIELDTYRMELKNINCVNNGPKDNENKDVDDNEKAEEEEEEYRKKDPIRKYQYDYNKTTCMTNKFPEVDASSALNFAPAEGKIPTSILKDKDWDINSFPNLHPSGQNKMFQDREIKLTPQQYLGQRLKNKDTRFEQCAPYVFAAAAFIEEKQMERNIGLSFNKGKKVESSDGSKSYELDDAFSVLDNVKSTPKYWKKAKGEILGKIDNFGPFHWFYTLSCADMRWNENFTSILREKGYKIVWKREGKDTTVKVEFQRNGEIEIYDLNKFLEEECDESLHEFIRTNVFTATRNFINRVKAFRTEILMGKNSPNRIKYWSDKMEFQGRGAGHIHGVAWCDLHEVSKLIKEEKKLGVILSSDENLPDDNEQSEDPNHLEQAYRSLRENNPLTELEEKALVDFVDRSVTCTLNPEMAAKMIDVNKNREDGMKIIQIVKAVQIHHHTKSCRKHGNTATCRFRFPKFPMWETILTKFHVDDDDAGVRNERIERHGILLKKVMDILEETELIEGIMNEYDKEEESIEEYRVNRKERIMKVLALAEVDPDDYVKALKESSRKGINVILARDIDEMYVNNYNPEWIEAWNGNIDWSPVFDFFAVVTYVTEYFTKDESGTSPFLAEASKQVKNLPIKDQRRCIKNVFLTHRQMGLSEAFMKIFPEIKLKDSNISSVFVPLGKRDDVSRYLMRSVEEHNYEGIALFQVEGREGLYYEKPNWLDKYLRRDRTEWDELCFPQYVKMFDPIHKKEDVDDDENNEENDNEMETNYVEEESNYEKDEVKYGKEVKFHYLITKTGKVGKALPNLMKIQNPYPGEPNYLRKRNHPKSLRLYKVKRDMNPSRFFLHELMMYKSFGPEDYDRWHDDEICKEDYQKYKDDIKKVKGQVMEWMEDVEEARYFVEEVMKNEVSLEETGEMLDSEMHKEDMDCDIEGLEEDENYRHLDPEGLKECVIPDSGNWFRKLELIDHESLEVKTCILDEWQRQVVDNGLKYVKSLVKYNNGFGSLPKPENLVVIGGAGAGKSTVIECLTQWCHRLLVRAGDDPNSPYVLKAATTGAASALIEGATVHTSLGFDFSSKHTSLSDKKRESKIEQLKNLKILIIDEFSMMKSDILYRIHLRLCEIKHNNQSFGGVNVYLLGDPAQLKPVMGSYIFAAPNCKDYKLAYGDGTDSLWRSFKVINLEKNHRQGKDKDYADILNRVRVGKQTRQDLDIMKKRVRSKGHPDLKDALFISAKVVPVARFNKKALEKIKDKLYVSEATHIQAMSKSFKPQVHEVSGRIGDTQYVSKLNIKKGSRVMLISNIDVSDLLCNGTVGTIQGIEEGQNGAVVAVIVKFDNPAAGKQARDRNPGMAKKYPQGTVIKKKEVEYSLAKNQGLISSTAKLIQFPLVLAWAVTVHKFQGQTVKSPQKIVVDLRSVFEAAQAYVMLSRVQELNQLYILEELPEEKIYASAAALIEIERLIQVSVNNNPNKWENKENRSTTKISFLNCRSLKNKFNNIKSDWSLLKSDVMILTETWLEEDDDMHYVLPDYDKNLNSSGKGKGIASYYRRQRFEHQVNLRKEGFSISKITSEDIDILGIYRSQNGNVATLVSELQDLIDMDKISVIGGDINICALQQPRNHVTASLKEMGFKQIVMTATHKEGGAIDHIYWRQGQNARYELALEYIPKYYSDHDALCLTLKEE